MFKNPVKRAGKKINAMLGVKPVKDHSIGAIDELDGFILSGWFIARHPDFHSNRYMVFLDETCLGTHEASMPRDDLYQAKGVRECGFVLNLEPLLQGLPNGVHTLNDGGKHTISIRTVRGRIVGIRELVGASPVQGFFDRLDSNCIAGWAIDQSRPGHAVELAMYVDGIHFMDLKTTNPRDDLIKRGIAGQKSGFSLHFPSGTFSSNSSINIVVKDSGSPLSDSPKVVQSVDSVVRASVSYLDAYSSGEILPVTVIVPIFNAYDAVAECLASVERYTDSSAQVLLINDCSTDDRIAGLLARFSSVPNFHVHHNETNLGYTRSVNKAIAMTEGRDVVLLNSDTVVTERWLETLRYGAYSTARVATVTALSDNAGAFSSPEIGVFNPVPGHLDANQFARAVAAAGTGRFLEVPTGNGFCLYIRRSAINEIGSFDEVKFPRGYGEENDFCMRALRRGWKNLVSDKAYVFHKRSQSFQGEKAALMEAGALAVNRDFPEYRLLTQRFRDMEFAAVRHRARAALAAREPALTRVLYVISTQTGGTPQTNMDLMRAMSGRHHCFLLRCDSKTITFSALQGARLEVREIYQLSRPIDPISHRSDEYDRVVLDMLYRHSISLLHIRHIGWHSLGLAAAAKSIGLPVIYSSHDFYAVCPSLNLLDNQLQHCGGKCTPGEGTCQIALWPVASLPPVKHHFIGRWREMFGQFLDNCDHVITTAPSAASILKNIFPAIGDKLTVIPHGRDFDGFLPGALHPSVTQKVRVLVPGNISLSKGAQLFKEIAELDGAGQFEFHFLGDIWAGLAGVGIHHGKYDRASFASKVREIAPHMGAIFSIWPETYCHTLTEMWSCGIPVIAFDIGAVGDRIRRSDAGWLIPHEAGAAEVLAMMKRSVLDRDAFESRVHATRTWQMTEGTWNDTSTMSVSYRTIYRRLMTGNTARPLTRLGLVIKGHAVHPPTAHIRVLRPLSVAPVTEHVDARPVNSTWLLAGGIDHLDALLIQRDAVPSDHAQRLISAARERGIPYIYEVDDWLWNIPSDNTDHSITAEQAVAMQLLASHANIVTTSTPRMAEIISSLGAAVAVIPNRLDETLWTRPLPSSLVEAVGRSLSPHAPAGRILYMGTKSHASDLQMIAGAIDAVRLAMPGIEIVQIGGGLLLPGAIELKVPRDFSQYPDFVQWFRAVSTFATIALAPLRADEFSSAKSDIKTLDYGFAGVPAIFSAVPPYSDAVISGETGLLVENTTASWTAAILRLLGDEALRHAIRSAAYERATARALGGADNKEWTDVLTRVMGTTPA